MKAQYEPTVDSPAPFYKKSLQKHKDCSSNKRII